VVSGVLVRALDSKGFYRSFGGFEALEFFLMVIV
jgi:hypothetical protein